MKKNIGNIDRIIRYGIVAIIIVIFLNDLISGLLAAILIFIGAVMIITSFTSSSPLYLLSGISTKKREIKHPIQENSKSDGNSHIYI